MPGEDKIGFLFALEPVSLTESIDSDRKTSRRLSHESADRPSMSRARGEIRDSILGYLSALGTDASVADIDVFVRRQLGDVSASSIRSYLNLNTPDVFERTGRGRYRLRRKSKSSSAMDEAVSGAFRHRSTAINGRRCQGSRFSTKTTRARFTHSSSAWQ